MADVFTIHAALAAVMDEVQGISKKSRNESQNFNFRGIDAVMNAVGPAFRKHGVVATPHVLHYEMQTVEVGQKRTPMNHVVIHVAYEFTGPAGDTMTAEVYGEAMDSGDKAFSKATSVAYRTALLQVLTIPTDEPDPDESSYERSASNTRSPSPAANAPASPQDAPGATQAAPATNGPKPASKAQIAGIIGFIKDLGYDAEDARAVIHEHTGRENATVGSTKKPGNITHAEAERVIAYLTAIHAERANKADADAQAVADEMGGTLV